MTLKEPDGVCVLFTGPIPGSVQTTQADPTKRTFQAILYFRAVTTGAVLYRKFDSVSEALSYGCDVARKAGLGASEESEKEEIARYRKELNDWLADHLAQQVTA